MRSSLGTLKAVSRGVFTEYQSFGHRMPRVSVRDRETGLFTKKGLLLRAKLT